MINFADLSILSMLGALIGLGAGLIVLFLFNGKVTKSDLIFAFTLLIFIPLVSIALEYLKLNSTIRAFIFITAYVSLNLIIEQFLPDLKKRRNL